jgi:bifunctional DNA-binding transcriptional regulator/antitoxin component of YhaV-PrlF toxin-antitoxin module
LEESVLKVRKKGVTILPKRLREEAGIAEDSEVKAKVLSGCIVLRPLVEEPVRKLENLLPLPRRGSSSVRSIRKLRKNIDRQVRGKVS